MPQSMQDKDIRRKDTPDKETPERKDMADTIEEMWPATLSEMADEAGYSRQHVKNTLDSHFEFVENESEQEPQTPNSITIPDKVENQEDYLLGWIHSKKRA